MKLINKALHIYHKNFDISTNRFGCTNGIFLPSITAHVIAPVIKEALWAFGMIRRIIPVAPNSSNRNGEVLGLVEWFVL